MAELEAIVQFIDEYLGIHDFPDYGNAVNGLQVTGGSEIRQVCAAVDASEATIEEAGRRGCDLLLVHHGLFWEGLRPVTGPHFRKMRSLIQNDIALYSAHLPLDAHAEVGNCVVLARKLGVSLQGRFVEFKGVEIGWWGDLEVGRDDLQSKIAELVVGPVRLIPGGPEQVRRVGVLTGGGGSEIRAAADLGLDAFITGEGAHHTFFNAMELGVNVYYAGHYATETWGVKALAALLEENFGISWEFIDFPTGL